VVKVVGIDPGFSGGIALVEDGVVTNAIRMPTIKVPVTIKGKKKTRSEYDLPAIAGMIREFSPHVVCIEKVSSRPGEGSTSSFRFGFGTGVLHGIAAGLGIDIVTVAPAKWKNYYGIGADKEESMCLARELAPDVAERVLKYKKDDGVAESILIALWAASNH